MAQFGTIPFIIIIATDIIIAAITVWAIYYGPRHAAERTRESDERREKERRRWEIFRTLMRYREELESEEFVDSLNLIEVEFCDYEDVIKARRELLECLNLAVIITGPNLTSYIKDRQRKMVSLLQAIANICNAKVNDMNIVSDAYISHEREKDKKLMIEAREWIRQILDGSRYIPVQVVNVPNQSGGPSSSISQSRSTTSTQSASHTPPHSGTVVDLPSDVLSSGNDDE